jgi:hypothetical protein
MMGRKTDYVIWNTQSHPGVTQGRAHQAVDENASVVMRPVFSGSILVSLASTWGAEIPNFTGGEAAAMKHISLSTKTHPGLLLDVSYDESGDLDRESDLTAVANGTQVVREVLSPVGKK